MTNEEAIELLCAYGVQLDEEKFCEALNMAISALSKTIPKTEIRTEESAEYFKKSEVLEMQHELILFGHSKMIIDVSDIEQLPTYFAKADGDLISRADLLNKIWQKAYGKDYDGVNMLNIPHIDIIENMPSYNSIKTELSGDLIPRQAVIKMLNKIENAVEDGDGFQFNEWVDYAKDIPRAEKTAEWIVKEDIHCSKCGEQIAYFVPNPNDAIALILDNKYCPNCGAKMVKP